MSIDQSYPLYKYWADYPERDKEYVRWYPPTLRSIEPDDVLDAISNCPPPLSFYLHVPFCKDICPYCPFNKFTLRDSRADAFMRGIAAEVDMVAARVPRTSGKITAGYFGGGTPTALGAERLYRLLEHVFSSLDIAPNAELTIEANPDTVDFSMMRSLRQLGVNRISFGVQSFQPKLLGTLGRTHGAEVAERVIDQAREAGFDNIAIDLIYRVPGQSVEDWRRDLTRAIELGVTHISTYCLFLDPGTRLYNATLAGRVGEYPSEDVEQEMFDETCRALGGAGYEHYTINDFALKGRASHHHKANWQAPQQSYLGLGPGAFAYIDGSPDGLLYCTLHSLKQYLASLEEGKLPVRLGNPVGRREKQSRYMVLGLRCLEVEKSAYQELFGESMDHVFGHMIAELESIDLLQSDAHRVWMTPKGMRYASNVLKAFYTDANRRMPQPIGVELMAGRGASMASVEPGVLR
ncbi:MAG: radical SAM family heme chaperone HemW [Alphaproteobacteria bacterium]|nr:radical SAM family heme chaperone HemW [Alphaproteobacteria bacterium]MCB9794800.1 radical SAM family heme chaperone HemW [Alphaproteobacteria bacterium]